jgi:signal transduction histidine kinase
VDAALRARAEAVASTIRVRDGQLRIAEGDDAALDAGTSIYLGQSLIEGSDLGSELENSLLQRGNRTADREAFGPVRYLAEPITTQGRQIGTIVVSSDTESRTRTAWIVGVASVGFIALLLLFTFFALRATVARVMRPVTAMGDQASTWSDKDIDRRFDPDAGPLELSRLALTLNGLLERISATLRHERTFSAELSHELRTPLAHRHAEVDLLAVAAADADDPEPVKPADLDDLLRSVNRLESLVESALAPARLQQQGAVGLARLDEILADLPQPAGGPPTLIGGRTDLTLTVEADVVRRALLPALENAWRYADREVRIDVDPEATGGRIARIMISDDGGRLDPRDVESIFEPGFRGDPDDGHPGAGLGLALTRRICRAAGGDATASIRDGRTTVTLALPCLPL